MSVNRPPPPPDPVMVLSGKSSVTSLVFLDADSLATGHQDGQIQEWSLEIQRPRTVWGGHSDTVLWLAWDEGRLVSQGRDGLVKAWARGTDHSAAWEPMVEVPSAPLIFCNCSIINSSGGKYLAVPSEVTSQVNIHEMNSTTHPSPVCKTPVHILQPDSVKQFGMCMKMCSVDQTKTSGHLLVGYESGSVALWDVLKMELLHKLQLHSDSVMCLNCWLDSSSGQIIGLSGSVDNVIQCWKIDNETLSKDKSVSVTNEGFNDIAIRKDGRIFVTGGWDRSGRVFGLKKLRPLAVLTHHKESINCVTFSPNNDLVMGSKDGYITFWNVYKNI